MKSKLGPITKRELKLGVRLSVEKMVEVGRFRAYRASLTAGHSSIVGFGCSAEAALDDLEGELKENLGT